jgi:hypothetical protein
MTNASPDISYILAAAAFAFAILAARQLNDPDRRRFRWKFASGLARDGGIAMLFGTMTTLFAGAIPPVAGIALVLVLLVSWLVSSTYLSRRASDEGRAHVEAIVSGKHDRGGYR